MIIKLRYGKFRGDAKYEFHPIVKSLVHTIFFSEPTRSKSTGIGLLMKVNGFLIRIIIGQSVSSDLERNQFFSHLLQFPSCFTEKVLTIPTWGLFI